MNYNINSGRNRLGLPIGSNQFMNSCQQAISRSCRLALVSSTAYCVRLKKRRKIIHFRFKINDNNDRLTKMRCAIVTLLLCCFLVQGDTGRLVINTHDQIGTHYQFFPLKTNHLQFSVKATNDIHVCLTNTPMLSGAYYEVVIGGWSNSKCAIRKDNGDHQVEYLGSVIKPNKFQTFSVTIDDKDGSIEVGKRPGESFMYYKDPDYVKMSYFGISTGFGSKGEWNFDFDLFYCNCTRCS